MSGSKSQIVDNVGVATKIFEEYGNFIKQVIDFKINNPSLADDLYQEFFLTLSTKPIPSDIKNMKGFLFYAITKDIIDSVRRIVRYQENLKKYTDYYQAVNKLDASVADGNGAADVEKMFQAIENHLSHREAQAVRLRYKHAYNSQEASEKMGITSRSFHRYVSVGLSKIRRTFTIAERGSS
jgi:RNA polymerase sigma factor (sigma-70 family)